MNSSRKWKLKTALTLIFLMSSTVAMGAIIPPDIQAKLDANNKELQAVNDQIEATKQNLSATTAQSKTLKEELSRIQSNISGLNLRVKASELTISKLGLEIDGLQYDIKDAETHILSQRDILIGLFQTMQRTDQESELVSLLRSPTVADAVLETESIKRISTTLASTTKELVDLTDSLNQSLDTATNKKIAQESERTRLKQLQSIALDEQNSRSTLLSQTKNQEKAYTQMLSSLESRQTAIASEIEKLEAQLRLTIDPSLLPSAHPGVLARPVDGPITQGYGATKFAKYGYRGQWHNGVDFGAPIGTPVIATESGTVVAMGNQDQYCNKGAYGKFIVISHDNNLTTLYGHLSYQAVHVGSRVTRGDLIGYVGKTGYATGPHLHLTVYETKTFYMGKSQTCGPMPYGGDINPLQYLSS